MANRGDDKSLTIPVGADVYVCLPYTLKVKKKKKKTEERCKKNEEKKEKRNRQSINNQTKRSKEKNLDVMPLGQSERAHYLRYFIKYV